jgi:hypothetical protein
MKNGPNVLSAKDDCIEAISHELMTFVVIVVEIFGNDYHVTGLQRMTEIIDWCHGGRSDGTSWHVMH